MAKTTYHEYRPGRWVKLVDGKAVGPATADEVAQWRQEQAEQAKIWRDVLKEAAEAAPTQADEGGIWQDVVSQVEGPPTQPATPGELTEPEPPLRTLEEAIRSARRGKPVTVKSGRVVSSDKPVASAGPSGLPEAKPTPPEQLAGPEPELTKIPPSPATATPAKRGVKPMLRSETQPAQEPAKPPERPLTISPQDTVQAATVLAAETTPQKTAAKLARKRSRAAVVRKGTEPKPAGEAVATGEPRPTGRPVEGIAPRVAEAQPMPLAEIGSVEQPPKPAPKHAKPVAPKEAAELEESPQMEAVPVAKPAEPTPRQAKPIRRPVEAEPAPIETVVPADEVKEEESQAEDSVARTHKTTRARPRGGVGPRRREAVSSPPEDRLGPAYLWIMVGAAEDLVASVRGALTRYEERFDERAGAVLCHAEDLAALEGARLPVDVRPRKGVPRRNFWIGPR